ncbi:MAG: serine/threonine-protein phosphatase [Deltaproteobacteria bacterium]|nr:serine/threonine-protein phosphatase [Deltaproteobacteria bacterium]
MVIGWGYGTEQRLRDENQDALGVFQFPDYILAIVCDGMGGHSGGAHASSMAVRIIHDKLREITGVPLREALEAAILEANRQIYDTSRRSHRLMGMGTAVVVTAVQDGVAHIAHVGDSRAYLSHADEAVALTRDHTMVNLFVEAELLSPEDAASHPEAHVLARALGIERNVEVEFQEPMPLESGDALILCTGGVHGLLTDWEIGRINWMSPQDGVRKVMQVVSDREGDDNATVAVLTMGSANIEVPLTLPPEIDTISDTISGVNTRFREDTPLAPPPIIPPPIQPPRRFQDTPPLPPLPAQNRAEVLQVPQQETSPFEVPPPPGAAPANAPSADPTRTLRDKPVSRLRVVLVALGGATLVLGVAVLALLMFLKAQEQAPSDPAPVVAGDPATPEAGPTGQDAALAQAAEDAPPEEPTAPVEEPSEAPPAEPPAPEEHLPFQVVLPDPVHFRPHRPSTYTRRPPGGTSQYETIQHSRNRECSEAMGVLNKAIQESLDFASLYRQVWYCFDASHARPLATTTADGPEDFRKVLIHLEGQGIDEASADAWSRTAPGGLEYRFEAWNRSSDLDRFREVMTDLIGSQRVADQLGRDLLVEAQAAVWLSTLPERTPETDLWWARRVYQGQRALRGPVGDVIRSEQPDLALYIGQLFTQAVPPAPEPPPLEPGQKPLKPEELAALDPVPAVVREAFAASLLDTPYVPVERVRAPSRRPVQEVNHEPEPLAKPKVYSLKQGAPPPPAEP